DVVLGYDLLRGDQYGDGAQRHAHHLLEGNQHDGEPRPAHAAEFSEQKHHAALVLPQHAQRHEGVENECEDDDDEEHAEIIARIDMAVEPFGGAWPHRGARPAGGSLSRHRYNRVSVRSLPIRIAAKRSASSAGRSTSTITA